MGGKISSYFAAHTLQSISKLEPEITGTVLCRSHVRTIARQSKRAFDEYECIVSLLANVSLLHRMWQNRNANFPLTREDNLCTAP